VAVRCGPLLPQRARQHPAGGLYSGQCLKALRQRHAINYHAWTQGSLELYFDPAELEHALDLRGRSAIRAWLSEDHVDEVIDRWSRAWRRLPGAWPAPCSCRGTSQATCASFRPRWRAARPELGARLCFGSEVRRIVLDQKRIRGVELANELIDVDAVVLAAGVGSRALARPLGLKLPIYPVKGYSATLELEQPALAPSMPLLDLEHRIVTARYGNRLRMAGLADFDGHDRRIRPDRLQLLIESACTLLPRLADEIRSDRIEAWTGLRPMTPKGPPMLGPTPVTWSLSQHRPRLDGLDPGRRLGPDSGRSVDRQDTWDQPGRFDVLILELFENRADDVVHGQDALQLVVAGDDQALDVEVEHQVDGMAHFELARHAQGRLGRDVVDIDQVDVAIFLHDGLEDGGVGQNARRHRHRGAFPPPAT
jgi:glycine/D-amino acid oxidase-like deaminating enzyme